MIAILPLVKQGFANKTPTRVFDNKMPMGKKLQGQHCQTIKITTDHISKLISTFISSNFLFSSPICLTMYYNGNERLVSKFT